MRLHIWRYILNSDATHTMLKRTLSVLNDIQSITIRLFIKAISTWLMHLLSFCSWIFPALKISDFMHCASILFCLFIKSEKIALRIKHATSAAIIALPSSVIIYWKQQACDKSPQFPIHQICFIHRYNPINFSARAITSGLGCRYIPG